MAGASVYDTARSLLCVDNLSYEFGGGAKKCVDHILLNNKSGHVHLIKCQYIEFYWAIIVCIKRAKLTVMLSFLCTLEPKDFVKLDDTKLNKAPIYTWYLAVHRLRDDLASSQMRPAHLIRYENMTITIFYMT